MTSEEQLVLDGEGFRLLTTWQAQIFPVIGRHQTLLKSWHKVSFVNGEANYLNKCLLNRKVSYTAYFDGSENRMHKVSRTSSDTLGRSLTRSLSGTLIRTIVRKMSQFTPSYKSYNRSTSSLFAWSQYASYKCPSMPHHIITSSLLFCLQVPVDHRDYRSPYLAISWVYLGVKTCEVFLCHYYARSIYCFDFFVFFVLRHSWRRQVSTPRMSPFYRSLL